MARLLKPLKTRKSKPRTDDKTSRIRSLLRDGLAYKSRGEYERAVRCYDQVFRIEPENPDALYAKCELYLETKQYSKALHLLERCRRSKPTNAQLNYIIGYNYYQLKRFDKAVVSLEAALEVNPNFSSASLLLAKVYFTVGQPEKARLLVETVPKLRPTNVSEALAHANLATDLAMFDRAAKMLRGQLETRQHAVGVIQELSRLPEQYPERNVAPLISRLLGANDTSTADKINLHFVAGQIADSEGRLDEAFGEFKTANDLSSEQFDLNAMDETVAFVAQTFTADFDYRPYRMHSSDIVPVFIVGMPRAGKTSLEQELCRHPDIADSKERELRMYIDDDIFVRVDSVTSTTMKSTVQNLSSQRRKEYAKTYMDQVLSSLLLSKRPKYILNTLPLNYQNAGMLKLLFPNAKFIHMKRDPVDTCWFCYSKEFKNEYFFTNKLDVLGKYYRKYQKMTQHWKNVLPEHWLDVEYEDLVTDPKTTVSRVLDFLGALDDNWDALSPAVGQGLTTGYIGYWKNYEKHLQPLLKSLNE